MHCSTFEIEGSRMEGGEILVAIAALVKEGRIPGKSACSSSGIHEGPHCLMSKTSSEHCCNASDPLCLEYGKVRSEVLEFWQRGIPLCVEVMLTAGCACKDEEMSLSSGSSETEAGDSGLLVEQWFINISHRRIQDKTHVSLPQLLNAVRSQLHFSQISSWLSTTQQHSNRISLKNIAYHLLVPGETIKGSQFTSSALKHDFPIADIGNGLSVQISLLTLPRLSETPSIKCSKCEPVLSIPFDKIQIDPKNTQLVDDRMHIPCTLKGKHRCEDFDEIECDTNRSSNFSRFKRVCHFERTNYCEPSTSKFVQPPKLNLDVQKAQSYKCVSQNLFRIASDCSKLKSELNCNDKRNLCQNEQKFKSPKLDNDKSNSIDISNVNDNTLKVEINSEQKQEHQSNGDILLSAILRSSQPSTSNTLNKQSSPKCKDVSGAKCDFKCVQKFGDSHPNLCANALKRESDNNGYCDSLSASGDIFSIKNKTSSKYLDKHCDSPIPKSKYKTARDESYRSKARQRITFRDDGDDSCDDGNELDMFLEDDFCYKINANCEKEMNSMGVDIPSAQAQAKFRKSLDSATSMVFHSRTGLPLTSSPAPIRKGKSCFDFDSSITSVSAIGNALFSLGSDDDSESDGSIVSPCSPDLYMLPKREVLPTKYCIRRHPNNLLGTFEESVLNGRLEPVSTVQGFTAELGASGSFVPKHLVVPVTVFFYNLGDNEKVSSPYLGHINLGRKGYQVPKCGTVQVTLFNPLGTVVKMFVIMYDLSVMPPNAQTFIRQRTLYMPTSCNAWDVEWSTKWLRYLIHLRFMSSKSGRIYLHSDIRIIICRKSDLDTATAHGMEKSYELRSFTHMPTNPQFSPRK